MGHSPSFAPVISTCHGGYKGGIQLLLKRLPDSPVLFGVLQGSVLGPLFFVMYRADSFQIAEELDFSIHEYADDQQIYRSMIIVLSMTLCSSTIDSSIALIVWVNGCRGTTSNSMRRKTSSFGWDQFVVLPPFHSAPSLEKLSSHHSRFTIIIDPSISFTDHVARLARTCYFQIRQLRSIRRSLTIEFCHALVLAMVLSRLDYCNGLLGGSRRTYSVSSPVS